MSMWDQSRVEFDEDGTLHQRGRDGWEEPICPECHEPIRWVLDMASFKPDGAGGFVMGHARCLWQPKAFKKEGKRAREVS